MESLSLPFGGHCEAEGFELLMNRRKRKPRNEAAARRVRMGAKKASKNTEGDEGGVDNDESARGVEGKSLPQ